MPGGSRYRCVALAIAVLALAAAARADVAGAVLRVGTSGDYKPFSFHDAAGGFTGFDVAVARRLSADLGRPLSFVPFQWPDMAAQLRAGAFDIAMSGVTVRADRAVQMTFTRPYAVTGAVVVIRVRDRQRFRRLDDFDRTGVRIAVNRGGHLEQVARRRFAQATLMAVSDNEALPGMLLHGRADAVVSEELEAQTWPVAKFVVLGPFTRDRKAYAMPREAIDLVHRVDDWLAAREADGWLNGQRRQWLGQRAMETPQQAGFEALVAAIDLRLQLMPLAAAVKRREHMPIEDPAQEARVLDHVRTAAAPAGLSADDVAGVFRVQIELAKAIEGGGAEMAPADLQLADVRAAVAAASDQIIRELARCQLWVSDARLAQTLDRAVRAGLTVPDLPPAGVDALIAALHHIRASGNP
ncbi:MAG TPA: transporter substrate-binding domain-containing protein [Candidatus Acidoferrales bacterium]|nr:transporter substrate-binding domain-containing protein [Candidatus Acidoferrales bacterium]